MIIERYPTKRGTCLVNGQLEEIDMLAFKMIWQDNLNETRVPNFRAIENKFFIIEEQYIDGSNMFLHQQGAPIRQFSEEDILTLQNIEQEKLFISNSSKLIILDRQPWLAELRSSFDTGLTYLCCHRRLKACIVPYDYHYNDEEV